MTVATSWPQDRCAEIESAIAIGPEPLHIRWIRVPSSDDPTHVVARGSGVDLVLGGRPESHARLALFGRIQPFDASDVLPWRHVPSAGSPAGAKLATLDDSPDEWKAEYARTVLATADGEPRFDQGRTEAVSLIVGSTHRVPAARFLLALGDTKPASPKASLLPDLLSASLVESLPELREARKILKERGDPARAFAWMLEAPPWPPASITRMRTEPEGMALIETLAGQIAPDKEARMWLLAAFDRVPKSLDGAILRELDEAVGGRLAADPRFRSWLRTEWTAWTGQRYRRVARGLLNEKRPTP